MRPPQGVGIIKEEGLAHSRLRHVRGVSLTLYRCCQLSVDNVAIKPRFLLMNFFYDIK